MDFFEIDLVSISTISNVIFGSDAFVIFVQIFATCFSSFLFFSVVRAWQSSLSLQADTNHSSYSQTDRSNIHDNPCAQNALLDIQQDPPHSGEIIEDARTSTSKIKPENLLPLEARVDANHLHSSIDILPPQIKAKLQSSRFPARVLFRLGLSAKGEPEKWFWNDFAFRHRFSRSDGSYDMVWQQFKYHGIIAIALLKGISEFVEFSIPPNEDFYAFDIDDISLEKSYITSEYGARNVYWYKSNEDNRIIIRIMSSDLENEPIADCIFSYKLAKYF